MRPTLHPCFFISVQCKIKATALTPAQLCPHKHSSDHRIFRQIIWQNRPGAAFCQRHIPIPSILCLVTTCSPSFLIIRGRAGNAGYFRIRISDMKVSTDQSRIITLALCRLIINPCCQDSTGSQKHSSLTHPLHCKAVLWHLL